MGVGSSFVMIEIFSNQLAVVACNIVTTAEAPELELGKGYIVACLMLHKW